MKLVWPKPKLDTCRCGRPAVGVAYSNPPWRFAQGVCERPECQLPGQTVVRTQEMRQAETREAATA